MTPSVVCSPETATLSTPPRVRREASSLARGDAAMGERLFGMEIVYGCTPRSRDPARPTRFGDWADRFMTAARERLPHLPSAEGGGIFLENGARFYLDCSHPEMTTPECANPWDVVRYMQAG